MPSAKDETVPPLLDTDGEEEHEAENSKKKGKSKKPSDGAEAEAGVEVPLGDDLMELLEEVAQDQFSPSQSSDEDGEEYEAGSGIGSSCEDEEEEQDGDWRDDDVSIVSEDALTRRYVVGSESFTHLKDPGLRDGYKFQHDPEVPVEGKVCRGATGERNDYKKVCEELGIIPCAKFMRDIHNDVMDLSFLGLNQKSVAAVCKALEENRHVRSLLLRGNDCGGEAGEALADLMGSSYFITKLDLARTNIIKSLPGICEALKRNTTLQVLDLSRNDLRDKDMKFVAALLPDYQDDDDNESGSLISLHELYLSRNYIQDEGLVHLANGIDDNTSLEILDLAYNRIWGEKTSLPFFAEVAQHENLRRLDLQGNSIKDPAGKAIAKTMTGKKSKLEYLNVSYNLLTAAVCGDFGKCFAASKTTSTLIAGPNRWNVGPLTQGYVAKMLTPLTKSKAPAAALLDLSIITPIHSQFMKPLETLKKHRPDIKVIHGQPFGFNDGARPNMEALIIQRAKVVCEDFETPLAMLIDELRTEPPILTTKKFKKFIKSCNLYKDKKMTKEFIQNFKAPGGLDVDCKKIIAAYDKEFPSKKAGSANQEFDGEEMDVGGVSASTKNMAQLLEW